MTVLSLLGNFDTNSTIILLIFSSLCIRQTLVFVGQHWATTFAHIATIFILPIITFCITSVISGNLALSLGMVGALSIVRFRNPVKSSFELSIYFLLISMGIVASQSLDWFLILILGTGLALFSLLFINWTLIKIRNVGWFTTSFVEANHLPTLEINSSAELAHLNNHDALTAVSQIGHDFDYHFASSEIETLQKLYRDHTNHPDVKSSRLVK